MGGQAKPPHNLLCARLSACLPSNPHEASRKKRERGEARSNPAEHGQKATVQTEPTSHTSKPPGKVTKSRYHTARDRADKHGTERPEYENARVAKDSQLQHHRGHSRWLIAPVIPSRKSVVTRPACFARRSPALACLLASSPFLLADWPVDWLAGWRSGCGAQTGQQEC